MNMFLISVRNRVNSKRTKYNHILTFDIYFNPYKPLVYFSKNQGEFLTDLVVVLDKNQFEDADEKLTVEDALKQSVNTGKVGSIFVDPESLTMGKILQKRFCNRETILFIMILPFDEYFYFVSND